MTIKRYRLPNGNEVGAGDQFQIGDQKYFGGWLKTASSQEISAIGIVVEELPEPEPELEPTPEPQPQIMMLPSLDFFRRLTTEEYGDILRFAQNALMANPSQPELSRWLDMVRLSPMVNVRGDDALAAKQFLVQAQLLSSERAEIVFALPN